MQEAGAAVAEQIVVRVSAPALPWQAPIFHVERIAPAALHTIQDAWADLTRRALEPNVFLEPAFACPLIQRTRSDRRPEVLVVWETGDAPFDRMVGLLPVFMPRLPFGPVRGFHDKLVGLGNPLLDRDQASAAARALLDWLAHRTPRAPALVLTGIGEGPFLDLLGNLGPSHRVEILASHRRAVLRPQGRASGNVLSLTSAKTRKARRRQRRRLSERGERAYVTARTPEAVAQATERFLALEHKGWKGRRGTALLADPAMATFARTMTRLMAENGQCRIDALEIGDRAAAMGIVLGCGPHAYFWKTTFDEELASLSPGVQFAIDLTEAQLGDSAVAMTDSCAIPDHPMIDKLWPDRLQVVDLAIALRHDAPRALRATLAVERARRRLRAWAKRWWRRLP